MAPTTPASRRHLESRVHLLTAIAVALDERATILVLIDQADDRTAAIAGLMAHFAWDENQARVVLDLQLIAWTKDRRASLMEELANAREALAL